MRSSFIAVLGLLPLALSVDALAACPSEARLTLHDARQLVLVETASWNTQEARASWWQRSAANEPWETVKTGVPAVIGRSGLAWGHEYARLLPPWRSSHQPIKREGDGRSPAGIHRLGSKFGFAAQTGDFLHLTSGTACVDDPGSRHYNQILDCTEAARDWKSAEMMREIDVYKIGFVVDYRSSAAARAGSCIFVHIWNGPGKGTAGCLAASEESVAELQTWIKSERKPAIAFLTEADTRGAWAECLPLAKARLTRGRSP